MPGHKTGDARNSRISPRLRPGGGRTGFFLSDGRTQSDDWHEYATAPPGDDCFAEIVFVLRPNEIPPGKTFEDGSEGTRCLLCGFAVRFARPPAQRQRRLPLFPPVPIGVAFPFWMCRSPFWALRVGSFLCAIRRAQVDGGMRRTPAESVTTSPVLDGPASCPPVGLIKRGRGGSKTNVST